VQSEVLDGTLTKSEVADTALSPDRSVLASICGVVTRRKLDGSVGRAAQGDALASVSRETRGEKRIACIYE
jgi:hypothetical protein